MSMSETRRNLLLAAASTTLLPGCGWPRFFDIGWTEPVQLHNGAVVDVTVKYTYERFNSGFTWNRYAGRNILRNTEFSFDAGPGIGRFTQLFRKHRVNILERFNGKWYLLLMTRGGALIFQTPTGQKEDWGSMENGAGQKCWSLDAAGFVRASINDLPTALLKTNILMDYAPAKELAQLNGVHLTRAQKKDHFSRYLMSSSDDQIERPYYSTVVPPPDPEPVTTASP
jgi:hypothetical protein